MKKQAGFTLIELIMVIVILGVLSAVALPKFVGLGSDARTAAMKAVAGSMSSANAMIYAKAAVSNQMGPSTATPAPSVTFNGTAGILTHYGFALNVTELVKAMDNSTDFTTGPTATPTYIQHTGAPDPTNCKVDYVKAADANTVPTYTVVSTGC